MKDYKRILAVVVVITLMVFISIFIWLWTSNRKNADPLPIITSNNPLSMSDNDATDVPISTLQIQTEKSLQAAVEEITDIFKARHPHVQVLVHYVPTASLLDLRNTTSQSSVVNTDLIMANGKISDTQLSQLQTLIHEYQDSQDLAIKNKIKNEQVVNSTTDVSIENDNNETRHLTAFSYALKDSQTVEGVILSDNPIAISFRNLLLSSAAQDVLNSYDYDNIDGYKNSVDDLFNPSSQSKDSTGKASVEIADVLSNGN